MVTTRSGGAAKPTYKISKKGQAKKGKTASGVQAKFCSGEGRKVQKKQTGNHLYTCKKKFSKA